MSADQEFYQSVWANVFVNSCYGTFPTISMGTNLPIYPFGGLGARIDYYPLREHLCAQPYLIPTQVTLPPMISMARGFI